MITYDFSNQSQRVRLGYYNLLSPAGKAQLALLMEKEKSILNNFVMSYETPELRKLAAKQKRNPDSLTPEEVQELANGEKSFQGLIADGGMIKDQKSIEVISNYIDCMDILEADLKGLRNFASDAGKQNSEIILGKQMSYWNLHPDQFPVAVYEHIFESPEYVRAEIEKLYAIKLGVGSISTPPKIFSKKSEIEPLLINYPDQGKELSNLIDKLFGLHTVGDLSVNEYANSLTSLINTLLARDSEFDFSVYENVKKYLPQYHNQKTRHFIYLLSQYNYMQTTAVNNRLDFITLQAFYRKADELCSF